MKHTKAILVMSTCFLAIAGVAATKAQKFVANARIVVPGVGCVPFTTLCTTTGTITCKTAAAAVSRTVFTVNSTTCVNKIHYKTQKGF